MYVHGENVDHYRLFLLCPNLVHYEQVMLDGPVFDSPSKMLLSKQNFHKLEECRTAELPPDLLSMIIQAPSIRIIACSLDKISKDFCQSVDLIDVFPNLECFCFSYEELENECELSDVD